jgi:hypothetical protein
MKKINKNIDFVIRKTSWSNADGDTKPSLTDAFYKDMANLYSTTYGQNDKIKNEIISKSKSIVSKYNNFKGKNIDDLKKILESITSERGNASKLENQAKESLIDKYDDVWTLRVNAIPLALRNIRDVEGGYPEINHKYSNLIKNVLDHHITWVSNIAISNYIEDLILKARVVEDEIEYAKEKNTLLTWKKLEGKGILDTQKKIISDNIKALTPKESATGTKVNTTATANELVNGTQPTSMKKWIIIGAGGLLVIGLLFFVFRKSSN